MPGPRAAKPSASSMLAPAHMPRPAAPRQPSARVPSHAKPSAVSLTGVGLQVFETDDWSNVLYPAIQQAYLNNEPGVVTTQHLVSSQAWSDYPRWVGGWAPRTPAQHSCGRTPPAALPAPCPAGAR